MSQAEEKNFIEKYTLSPGQKYIPLTPGTRVKFHYQTKKASDGTLIDDSRKTNQPMELVLGKQFKLEVWEAMVQKMALHEVSKFIVDKSLVTQYPFISKTLRDLKKKPEERRHCCGMTLQNEGLGYKDLDELFSKPCDLEFIVDLFSVELPEDYEKERWQMTDDEKLNAATTLREKGNRLYREKHISEAAECYREAVAMLEQLMLKEKPHDTEWDDLAKMKIPLLLNYSQCKLVENEFYSVIEHCSEVLTLDPDNVKALFRRAKAHSGAWNPEEAREDFRKAASLDPSLQAIVTKELKLIDDVQKQRDLEDKKCLQKMF